MDYEGGSQADDEGEDASARRNARRKANARHVRRINQKRAGLGADDRRDRVQYGYMSVAVLVRLWAGAPPPCRTCTRVCRHVCM